MEPLATEPMQEPRAPNAVSGMPALAFGKHSHHHTVHSALATLEALGVSAHRISVERTGREAVPPGTVVGQAPDPGTPLRPDTRVHLRVAGLGFSHALPVGMWDSGGERELGTRELLGDVDDPLEKLKHWFHEGAPLFRLSPEDPASCARWLVLFGVDPDQWPRRLWYTLATLVANLSQYSCSQQGCAFVLRAVLGLPVQAFRTRPNWSNLPETLCSGLGRRASRLGLDLVLGDRQEHPALLEIELGPVALAQYEYFAESPEGKRLLRQLLEWVVPVSTDTVVRWSVLDRSRPPQLGVREGNSRLGINTHMGGTLGTSPGRPAMEVPRLEEQPGDDALQLSKEPLQEVEEWR